MAKIMYMLRHGWMLARVVPRRIMAHPTAISRPCRSYIVARLNRIVDASSTYRRRRDQSLSCGSIERAWYGRGYLEEFVNEPTPNANRHFGACRSGSLA